MESAEKEKQIHLKELYTAHPNIKKLLSNIANNASKFQLKGGKGSSYSLFAAGCFLQNKAQNLIVLNDKEAAAYFYNDIKNIVGEKDVFFFPSSYKRSMFSSLNQKIDPSNIILRTEVLNNFQKNKKESIIVSYPEGIIEKVITRTNLESNTLHLKKGEKLSIDFVEEILIEYGFERLDFVFEPGQYAVRGSIVDIFSFSNDYPFRLDFFGDEVESIRTFDIVSQLSKASLQEITIVPDIQNKVEDETKTSFLEFINKDTFVWLGDTHFLRERIDILHQKTKELDKKTEKENQELINFSNKFISKDEFSEQLKAFTTIEMNTKPFFEPKFVIHFNTSPQKDFNKNFELLAEDLLEKTEEGYRLFILSENEKQHERLNAIFEEKNLDDLFTYTPVLNVIHEGFVDHDLKMVFYTDHQIFKRFHKFSLKSDSPVSGKEAMSIQELSNLKPGDFVVHVDHGIGVFGGLQSLEVNGKMQETIRLIYKDNDVLFVSIHSLHRISKYRGKESTSPQIHKLGSGVWQRQKNKTKSKVKDIAKEIIALYAKRKAQKGFPFSQDTYLQHELESSFIYEDTPDQVKATSEVKKDLESEIPMDRLVCGDVGFGKTEIAIRAAFKAVADNKQVAVLVPTTILALQHYKTFSERLKDFPCKVDYISRLRKRKDQKESLKALEQGKIDILIGTHKIIGKETKFKDLGLLIIDEEQKFGVSVKEKLKTIKVNVDTLTLTATPIPRTLQFSLMGARDLSVIKTPPPNRFPIITELHTFNEDIIREAINYEIERNGQVFFINNRIQNILEIEALINRLCPHVRTAVAHGQMDGQKLEKIMLDFINEEYGVLIATTIIESGLDIPNANTIIINNAQNFGLSDLHQLRGRVGRANKKAFAFLLSPPLSALTPEARRRLQAIENFSELGSGFNIALQDLDIRGAGNLLGGEQSGFISDIGFETYHRILDEALLELRENEFKELFKKGEIDEEKFEDMKFVSDCQIDTDLELVIPETYINNVAERIKLYRELDNTDTEEKLLSFASQLKDRFGALPQTTVELLDVVRLRWKGVALGFEKIILKQQKMICHFIADNESGYFQSPIWTLILKYLQSNPKKCKMKENKNRLSLIFDKITNVKSANKILDEIKKNPN